MAGLVLGFGFGGDKDDFLDEAVVLERRALDLLAQRADVDPVAWGTSGTAGRGPGRRTRRCRTAAGGGLLRRLRDQRVGVRVGLGWWSPTARATTSPPCHASTPLWVGPEAIKDRDEFLTRRLGLESR
jgi:hypothetical protein